MRPASTVPQFRKYCFPFREIPSEMAVPRGLVAISFSPALSNKRATVSLCETDTEVLVTVWPDPDIEGPERAPIMTRMIFLATIAPREKKKLFRRLKGLR